MNKLVIVICTIAFVVLISESSAQKCRNNRDCVTSCMNANDAVCDVPSGECHCHAHGEILCNDHATCRRECYNSAACCNNDHHCHCDEPCLSG